MPLLGRRHPHDPDVYDAYCDADWTPSYYDPHYRYDVGHTRRRVGRDEVDPMFRAREKRLHRAAAHGEMDPLHPEDVLIYGGKQRHRERSPRYVSPPPRRGVSLDPAYRRPLRDQPHAHLRSTYDHYPVGVSGVRTEPAVEETASLRPRRPATPERMSLYGTPIPEPPGGARYDTLDESRGLVWYPSHRKGGILRGPDGTELPLSPRKSIPYGTALTRNVGDASYADNTSTALVPQGYAGAFPLAPQTRPTRVYGTTTDTARSTMVLTPEGAMPISTVAAIDRANRLALEEEARSRTLSYTKVGPLTFFHGNGPARRARRRSMSLGAVPHIRTTTEAAVLRASSIAAEEARREQVGRRGVTRIGPFVF